MQASDGTEQLTNETYALVSFGHRASKDDKHSSFFFPVYVGMLDAALLLNPAISIEWHGPLAWDPVPEIEAIHTLTDRQVDGIIVTAADAEALNPSIDRAIAQGIPVINFDADSPGSQRLTFVGTDSFTAGYQAGKRLAQWLDGEGDILVVSIANTAHLNARLRGFQEAVAHFAPYATVHVDYQLASAGSDETQEDIGQKCRESSRLMFQKYPNIRGAFTTFAGVAPDVALAAEMCRRGHAVKVLGFDIDSRIVKFLLNDRLRGVVQQDAYLMGYLSMVLAHAARHAKTLPEKNDGEWRKQALQHFLTRHAAVAETTAPKLQTLLRRLEADPSSTLHIDAEIFNRHQILNVFTQVFEDTRLSLSDKISSLVEEIKIRNQSEKQYRLLAEQVKNGILILQQGTLVFVNKAFRELIGEPISPPLSLDSLLALIHQSPSDSEVLDLFSESGKEGAARQLHWSRKDGRLFWAEIERSSIMWNAQPAILLAIHDITQSKERELYLVQERLRLQQENLSYKTTIAEHYRFGPLIGKSPSMRRLYELIVTAAASDINVLLIGESGTGKELIARTIHQVGARKKRNFVAVNCASIPETLFEREFFGHRKGAFSGADCDRPGFLDRAHRGVLFLDEVTELTPAMQAKLLRVLQDGEYTPLGSNQHKKADIQLVSATNKHYEPLIQQKRLREDFFYRICVLELNVPSLRERKEDLPLLIDHILELHRPPHEHVSEVFHHSLPKSSTMLPGVLIEAFYAYHWPGNVRELQNILRRYMATQDSQAITTALGYQPSRQPYKSEKHQKNTIGDLSRAVETLEKQMIADALTHTRNNRSQAAKLLNLPRRTLYIKLKKYGL